MRWALLFSLLFLGCDDGGDDDGSAGVDPTSPEAGDTYVAGLEKAGAQLTVRLVEALPAPPEKGDNRWILEVQAGDAMRDDCELVLTPDMPAHNHGTWKDVVVTPQGEGRYEADPVFLFMPGLWEIPVDITCGELTDNVVYRFWIEG